MQCNCDTCPYDIGSYLDSVWCDKVGGKTDWYGYCEDAFEDVKINDRNEITKVNIAYPKYSKRKDSRERYQTRLKQTYNISRQNSVSFIEEKWDRDLNQYITLHKPYYRRCHRGNHKGNRYKFYKKYSNKMIRKYGVGLYIGDEDIDELFPDRKSDGQLRKGNSYRKVFDYWWTVD